MIMIKNNVGMDQTYCHGIVEGMNIYGSNDFEHRSMRVLIHIIFFLAKLTADEDTYWGMNGSPCIESRL